MISQEKLLAKAQQFVDPDENVRIALAGRTDGGSHGTTDAFGNYVGRTIGTKALVVATDRHLYWVKRWAFDWRRLLTPSPFIPRKDTRSSPLDRRLLNVSHEEGAGDYRGTDRLWIIRPGAGFISVSFRPGRSEWQREAAKQIVSIVEGSEAGLAVRLRAYAGLADQSRKNCEFLMERGDSAERMDSAPRSDEEWLGPREGPSELWARFDAALQSVEQAAADKDLAAGARAFADLASAANALADAIAGAHVPQQ